MVRKLFSALSELLRSLALAALLLSSSSCGGGTTGSGGGGFAIGGVLKTPAQAPVAGVRVDIVNQAPGTARLPLELAPIESVGDAGDASVKATTSAITDAQGNFSLSLDSRPTSVQLRFQGPSFDSTLVVTPVPEAAASVQLSVIFDEAKELVEHESETYEDENGEEVEHDEHPDHPADQDADEDGGSSHHQ